MPVVCFRLPGKKICINIPDYIDPHPPLNHPDPRWVEVEGLEKAVIQDLERLASMRGIAQHLARDRARPVLAALDAGIAKIKEDLPHGYEITVGH